MEGKTLFFKFNTGPSGHGSPPSAGEAVALKKAGAGSVRVFAFEARDAVVDTNVGRILARVTGRTLARVEARRLADSLVPEDPWSWNQ